MADSKKTIWQLAEISSPHLPKPVEVIAAKDIPHTPSANRLQTLHVYLPKNENTLALLNRSVASIPTSANSTSPQYQRDRHSNPSREARHPQHLRDVLSGFALLWELASMDGSYVLTGHSAGACLSMQLVLQAPEHFGLNVQAPPCPAGAAGLNGLYDLPALVHGLGDSYAHLSAEYASLQGQAFGTDESAWASAIPALFDARVIEGHVKVGKAPKLVLINQSTEDQLVPMNQAERLEARSKGVKGMTVVREGVMIWETVSDVLAMLKEGGGD
ncbi:hypothetical protein K469DRAFT_742922 [Zopfia rhizophila CBS 207.26]|uniref:Alpha/beta-hydrolase n=1 Tax=Zopfia rhizophila CBS 207.26 TaxID=1314779 RepID=A0A6A6DAC5_9PEZI|nr:hypothetical protein K469DRAFT_742922 [Zopfia rhizophila CBS 207.26]